MKRGNTLDGCVPYTIIRQHPKITCSKAQAMKLGTFNGYLFCSQANPSVGASCIWLRGTDKTEDLRKLWVSKGGVDKFEKAVLELNKKYSNNSVIENKDVIWRRGDK